jgi:hypothetical protein
MEEIVYDFIDYKIKKIENELNVLDKSYVFLLKASIDEDILFLKELGSYYADVLVDHMEFVSIKIENYFHMLDVQKMREEIHNRIVQLTVDIEVDCDYSTNPVVNLESFFREKDAIALEMKVLDKFGANEEEMNELKYLFGGISMSLERLISI